MNLSPERQAEYDELGLPCRPWTDSSMRALVCNKFGGTLTHDELANICKYANAHHANQQTIEELTAENEQLKSLLGIAKCPNCDGGGAILHDDGNGGFDFEQCRWCYEKNAVFNPKEQS